MAFIAGIVNTVGFYSVVHEALTHLTGTTTNLAISLAKADWKSFSHLAGIILSFFGGSALGGIIIGKTSLQLGMRYGWVLGIESGLLFFGMITLDHNSYGDLFITMACGLQNAMAATYSGAIVRSTHITGLVTDLGVMLGHWLRGEKVPLGKVTLLVSILSGFFWGGLIGFFLYQNFQNYALLTPVILTGGAGLIYTFVINVHHITPQWHKIHRGYRHRRLKKKRIKIRHHRHRLEEDSISSSDSN